MTYAVLKITTKQVLIIRPLNFIKTNKFRQYLRLSKNIEMNSDRGRIQHTPAFRINNQNAK